MKKIFILPSFAILLFASCQTVPLEVPALTDYKVKNYETKPVMEFIGFKASADTLSTSSITIVSNQYNSFTKVSTTNMSNYDSWKLFKDQNVIRNLGAQLEENNIAIDQSTTYFGIYSLQELELYKSKTRYVTFIQVNRNDLTWEGKDRRNTYGLLGTTFLGCGLLYHLIAAEMPAETNGESNSDLIAFDNVLGVGCDLTGLIFLINAAKVPQTTFNYEGNFDICIYDTVEKKLLRRDELNNVRVYVPSQTFNGLYSDYDKNKVATYFGKIVAAQILMRYEKILQELKLNNN